MRVMRQHDWLEIMADITYQEACQQNWPRPTCKYCGCPTSFDRAFRATGCCNACYDELEIILKPKELLPCHKKS